MAINGEENTARQDGYNDPAGKVSGAESVRDVVYVGTDGTQGLDRGSIRIEPLDVFGAGTTSKHIADLDVNVGPLIRGIVESARLTGALSHSSLYRLTFSSSATAGLADGTLAQVAADGGLHSWVVDSGSKKIVEHGVLNPATFTKSVAVAGAGWQIMAAITAQKYLADMSRQLAAIQSEVEAVRRQLEEDREGKLLGNLQYLKAHAAAISGKLMTAQDASTVSHQLESIQRESSQLSEAIKRGIQNHIAGLVAIKLEYHSAKDLKQKSKDAFLKWAASHDRYSRGIFAALLCRIVAVEQALILDPNSVLASAHIRPLLDEIDNCEKLLQEGWSVLNNKAVLDRHNFEKMRIEAVKGRIAAESWPIVVRSIEKWAKSSDIEWSENGIRHTKALEATVIPRRDHSVAACNELRKAMTSVQGIANADRFKSTGTTFVVSMQESGPKLLDVAAD